ncbi:MAG: DUF4091 domain-containing protein [Phycisphaerae bacterium]|nr:DUF4091 domain-containing protein [Phycisphaerae bacterium]
MPLRVRSCRLFDLSTCRLVPQHRVTCSCLPNEIRPSLFWVEVCFVSVKVWLSSSLRRQFPLGRASGRRAIDVLAARGERVSFQACLRVSGAKPREVAVEAAAAGGLSVRVRRVGCVPVPHHNTDTPADELDGVGGFLHWGYNYWYKSQTRQMIDPFTVSDGLAWPGWAYGDTFQVYPGPDGPIDSIRWEVFAESLQDYALLQTLGVDRNGPMLSALKDFDRFPKDARWFTSMRKRLLFPSGK